MSDKAKVSRRDVLRSALLLSGAACAGALQSHVAYAQQKASKAVMKYQDKPNGEQKCSNCLQFEPPSGCKVVDGTVSPDGYCIAWVKKA